MKDSKLIEMKSDYQNIPIPRELKERVTRSVEAAKEELAAASGNASETASKTAFKTASEKTSETASEAFFRKTRTASQKQQRASVLRSFSMQRLALKAAAAAAAVVLFITVMANSNEAIAYAMEQIPVINAIARIVTFREYSHNQNNMEANVKVPSVSVEQPDGTPLEEPTKQLNQKIEEYTSEIIAAFEADVAASGEEGHEALNLDYEIVTDNDRLFTLRFDQTIVMAGAMHAINIYNLDKTTGNLITLKDLFAEGSDYVTAISDSIKEQMSAQMAADENIQYFYQTDMPELNFSEIDAEEDFYISKDGKLTLVFDKYQIAPGYMGSVEFEIPTEAISEIVKEGYVK